ncbi:hypothetical protein KKB18_12675 [bacterium]|nr:hypothetical protein [bacterium]
MKKIDASSITIFDISENNPNVLIEAGIALGTGKHVIFLKCEQSKSKYPSNIHNFIFLPYRSSGALSEESFLESVINSIEYFLSENHDAYFYHRLLWSLMPNSKTIIIPGTLPENYTGNRFEDYIDLRNYTDLDAIFTVMETVHRLYPRMDISIQSASNVNDLPREWEQSNIIFIGGPDFNRVVSEFDNLSPIEYKYGHDDEEVWLQHKKTGKEYKPRFYEKGGQKYARDYGFFLTRRPKKYNPAKIIFIGGARTWGVYGAALLVSCRGFDKNLRSYSNARQLIENFGNNPSLLIPVEVTGSRNGINSPTWFLNEVECLED